MDKMVSTTVQIDINKHEFYCDECGEFIGESEEFDDGYYKELGEYELKFFVDGDWYKLQKHFCKSCSKKYTEKIQNTLLDLGFVVEEY